MIRKFASLGEAMANGFTIDMGNGEYAEGGEMVSRERYARLFEAIGSVATQEPFVLPDLRDRLASEAKK